MQIPLDPMDEAFLKLVSVQKDAAVAVVNLANKVDENRFRKKSADAITGILARVIEQEKTLGLGIVVGADEIRH